MNLLSLVGPRLDNICQIRRKWYYLSGSLFLQSERGPVIKGLLHFLYVFEQFQFKCALEPAFIIDYPATLAIKVLLWYNSESIITTLELVVILIITRIHSSTQHMCIPLSI